MATRQLQVNSLTQSGGVITAVLNGQTYTVAASGLTANTLYMIYFTSQGLVISTSPNSAGPAGVTSWRLVGAFYSSGTNFGNFIGIKGKPESLWVPFASVAAGVWVTATTNPTFGNALNNIGKWKRSGTEWLFEWDFAFNSAGTAPGTNPTAYFNLPQNILIDLAQKPATTSTALNVLSGYSSVGVWSSLYPGNSEIANGFLVPNNASQLRAFYGYNGGNTGSYTVITNVFAFASGTFALRGSMPIVGWTNTPLEDL